MAYNVQVHSTQCTVRMTFYIYDVLYSNTIHIATVHTWVGNTILCASEDKIRTNRTWDFPELNSSRTF